MANERYVLSMAWSRAVIEIAEPPSDTFNKTTVLLRAVQGGVCKQVRFFLEHGCDPNQSSGARNIRPLMMACYVQDDKKRLSIMNSLLMFGADPSLGDVKSRNSLMYACALAPRKVVEALLYAADYDLNAVDDNGNTSLHFAAIAGNIGVQDALVKRLQKLQLDMNIRNDEFLTPLSTALLNQNTECAQALYDIGALPRFTDHEFQKILSGIAGNNHRMIIDKLISKDLIDKATVHTAFRTSDTRQLESLTKLSCRLLLQRQSTYLEPVSRIHRSSRSRSLSTCLPSIHHSPSAKITPMRSRTVEPLVMDGKRGSSFSTISSVLPQSSFEVYDDLMSRYYRARNSTLYCPPPKNVVKIDTKWIESINSVHVAVPVKQEEQPPAADVCVSPDGARPPRKLARMSSTPRTPSGSRPRLSRMVTSPGF